MMRNGAAWSHHLVSVSLCAMALACSAVTGFILSFATWDLGKEIAISGQIVGWPILGSLCVTAVALINRRGSNPARTLARIALPLGFVCVGIASVIPFCLANCCWSCRNQLVGESVSPGGKWKAVWFSRECEAPIRSYCPSASYLSILPRSAGLPNEEGNALSILNADGLRAEWKTDDHVVIWYPGIAKVLRARKQVDGVTLEYRWVGFM